MPKLKYHQNQHQKIRLKKVLRKKNWNTPTQKIEIFNFLAKFTRCSRFWTIRKIELNCLVCLTVHKHSQVIMIFDFSISIPVWRKSSPNKVNFDRFFGGFWQFLRRWYELDPNRLQHNNQCKILNKISPIWATFEQIFDFLKK